jgi:uncharacterized protein (DUF1800 family)
MFGSRCLALFALVLIATPLASPLLLAQQRPPAPGPQADIIEPFVKRTAGALNLTEEQVSELRGILAKHSAKLVELRNRGFGDPYNPKLQAAIEDESKAIREEFAAALPEQEKSKLSPEAFRVLPQPPGFIPITVPPSNKTAALAADRLVDPPAPASSRSARAAAFNEDQKILQVLNRITFGPTPGQVDQVKQMGLGAFLEQQLHPETIDDSDLQRRLDTLPTTMMTVGELYQWYPQPNVATDRAKQPNPPPVFGRPFQVVVELMQQRLVRAVSSRQQLQEVMTDFWFNHFNVFLQKGNENYLLPAYERDVIRPNSLGNFHDLLLAVAQSPAMLFYLDNWLSTAPDAARPKPPSLPRPGAAQPNASPAAKPVQVSAPKPAQPSGNGVTQDSKTAAAAPQQSKPGAPGQETKPAAAPKPPAPAPAQAPRKQGINENYARELLELHTLGVDGGYTQKDVQEVARCLTGWTVDRLNESPSFVFRPWMHDTGAKTVLGVTIPAGGGISDGLRVIDIVSRHPSSARFISRELCQRFVADDPPAKLVERVAQVFLKTDGDIKEVLRAIFASPEFNSPASFRAKVKSPLELAASAIRSVDGDTDGGPPIQDWLRRMGEPLYGEQFPTGYGEKSERWVNTGVFLNRLNFLVAIANNQVRGTSYDQSRLAGLADAHIADQAGGRSRQAGFADPLTARLEAAIVHTPLSTESRRAVTTSLESPTAPAPNGPPPTGPGHSYSTAASAPPGPRTQTATLPAAPAAAVPAGPAAVVPTGQPVMIPARYDSNAARHRVAQIVELMFGTAEFQRR